MKHKVFHARLWTGIKVVIGLGLLCYLFFAVDWSTAWAIIKDADILLLVVIVVLFFPGVFTNCLKWKLLLNVQQIVAPMRKLFPIYLIGSFFQNFAPSTLGHDVSRLYYMRGLNGKGAQNAASIIMERAIGILALILWFFIAAFVNYDLVSSTGVFTAILLFFLITLILIAVVYLMWKGRVLDAGIKRFQKINLLKRTLVLVDKFIFALSKYRNAPSALFIALLLSMFVHLLGFFSNYLLVIALHLDVSFFQLLFIMPIINLIAIIPISVNSWGIREGAFVLLFGQLGLSIDQAMSLALLGRALLIVSSLSGMIILVLEKIGWMRIDWQNTKKG